MSDFPSVPDVIIEEETNIDVVVIAPRKRRRDEDIIMPSTDGKLTITVYIISVNKETLAFSQTKKSLKIELNQSGRYLSRIDMDDARNNIEPPTINASVLHSLVISHFGELAQNVLNQIKVGSDPQNSSKLSNTNNPEYNVRFSNSCIHSFT